MKRNMAVKMFSKERLYKSATPMKMQKASNAGLQKKYYGRKNYNGCRW